MGAWDSWATTASSKAALLQATNYLMETKERDSDISGNSHFARERVRAEWARTGVSEATAQWHAQTYRGSIVASRIATGGAGYLLTNGAPIVGASYVLVDGFSPSILTAGVSQPILAGWHFVIWGDPTIYRVTADAQTGGFIEVGATSNSGGFNTLDLVSATKKFYYADRTDKTIRRCNLDGTSDELIYTGAATINGIAVDGAGGKVYFAENTKIRSCGLDGSSAADVISYPVAVLGLAIDVAGAKLYHIIDTVGIYVCDTDGTDEALVLAETGTDDFWDIAIDVAGNKMYWSDYGDGTIERATLAGASQTSILTGLGTSWGYLDIDVSGGFIYWETSGAGGNICRVPIAGGTAVKIQAVPSPTGITIDTVNHDMFYSKAAAKAVKVDLPGYLNAHLNVSPVVSAAAAALGDNARVHFFIPQDTGGAFYSHPKGYSISLTEEFTTPYSIVYEPEPK